MNRTTYSNKAIGLFFSIVIVLSGCLEYLVCTGKPQWLIIVLMWVPTVAASFALAYMRRSAGEAFSRKAHWAKLGFRRCRLRYILMGWLIPLIYLLVPYMIYWAMYPENYGYHGVSLLVVLKDCLPMTILGVFVSLLSALGEEIGWRGFMVPALHQRLGLQRMLVVTSLFWCMWHLPLLIGGGYMDGTPIWYRIPAFILGIFPVGVITAVLTLESGSIWPAAFLHAAHNNYDQAVLDVITRGDNKMYFVSETGVFTIVCAWILAVICYVRYVKKAGD